MKDRINEHEMTQKMMEIMRGGYKELLSEADGQFDPSSTQVNPADMDTSQQAPEPDDVIELRPGDATYDQELQSMRDTVSGGVVFTSFNIYPSDSNVVIDGYLEKQESKDSGIFFKMALTASDIETSMVDVELDDKVNDTMKRLAGYYPKFEDDWLDRIHEYTNKSN
jgi:hypothetical protein